MVGDVLRNTKLWRNSLSENADWEPASRDKFRTTLDDMRQNVTHLANQIAGDLPEYTQHDISHLDALWAMADLLAGDAITLNPATGFVLGAAILTHDLAMSRAAYKISKTNIRSVPEWGDCLALELRRRTGKVPSPTDLVTPPEDVAQEVERILLRKRHALQAEQLPLAEWANLDGTKSYLINDPAIRSAYGRVVGRIAGSHHWDSHKLPEEFGQPVGAPSFAPADWTVDQLLLACLLRCADAAHLDASRAPDVLAAIAPLPADSRDHWLFQSKLQRPYLAEDRLVFTAQSGFDANEISAWWLAFDTLKLVDNELRHVDNILSDNERPRLRANAVSHVDSPRAFSRVAPCHEWEPVEARVQVSDVAGLVRRLGGAELYGGDKTAAFRELLVNACDAVRARQALAEYRGKAFDGRVTVTLAKDGWLEVADNGIGMSPEVLAGPLLDFGHSSWLSNEVIQGNPGLAASQFAPTGKFGIGFFSIFMLGSHIKVISRSTSAGLSDTWVIELTSELTERPVLRRASSEEFLDQPGTMVRVILDEGFAGAEGKIDSKIKHRIQSHGSYTYRRRTLDRLVTFILPCSEVSIWVRNEIAGESPKEVIHSGDWLTMSGSDLLLRISGAEDSDIPHSKNAEWAKRLGPQLRCLTNPDGQIVARACILGPIKDDENTWISHGLSVITAGPARTTSYAHGAAGIFCGLPSSATRDSAIPSVDQSVLAAWLTDEAVRVSSENPEPGQWATRLLQLVSEHGGDSNSLPGWRTTDGWLNNTQLVEWIAARQEIFAAIVPTSSTRKYPVDIVLPADVIWSGIQQQGHSFGGTLDQDALKRIFTQAVSEAWSTSLAAVAAAIKKTKFTMLADRESRPIGTVTLVLLRAELEKA
jgi:hypothetical protein